MSHYTVEGSDPRTSVELGYSHAFGNDDQIGGYFAAVFESGARRASVVWGTDNELPTWVHLVHRTRMVIDWNTPQNRRVLQRLVDDAAVDAIGRLTFTDDEQMLLADAVSRIAS